MRAAEVQRGATSIIRNVFILDATKTDGSGKTGLTYAAFTIYYKRALGSAAVAVTLDSAAVTLGTYEPTTASHGAIKEIDATHCPGLYEFHLPNRSEEHT